ncbi:hypothetical protein NHL50_06555 [Acidimicrobiia bacterium EGI L10123]|uniref:hypothetical protein n=1 Tax=Salinilacustrithrix flava TaxID=2957203 RepID=UPI003D7C1634|nr:hypothetical protein [Acidimicrobiia bacterium EGI L10123]
MSAADRWRSMRSWPARRWSVAAVATTAYVLAVGIPTDLVPNPVFGREIPPTWWSWPSLAVSAVLAGLLAATYVDTGTAAAETVDPDARRGMVGGVLTFFAVGCPVCNKLVLIALGSAGAITWFEPVQPLLQLAAMGLLLWALDTRLGNQLACPVPAIAGVGRSDT